MSTAQLVQDRHASIKKMQRSAGDTAPRILQELQDPAFVQKLQRYSRLVVNLTRCDYAFLSYVHHGVRHVVALSGTDTDSYEIESCPDDLSICQYVGDEYRSGHLFHVHDLGQDDRFSRSPLTTKLRMKSYVGLPLLFNPLISGERVRIGTLVAGTRNPRVFNQQDFGQIEDLGRVLCTELESHVDRVLAMEQRRMQKSLVQFVRGNLPSQEGFDTGEDYNSLVSDLDEEISPEDADLEAIQTETSSINKMFDFATRLIRRTLRSCGVILCDIEDIASDENILLSEPRRCTIMGACFTKNLRNSSFQARVEKGEMGDIDLSNRNVHRDDVFSPHGLSAKFIKGLLEDHPRAIVLSKSELHSELLDLLPNGCASVLLSPIYDLAGKAFALTIVWSSDEAREFSSAERHYVEAFGSSIMSEVLNQALRKADQAKALFISKISHELRTPLHGILASAEFLNDTNLNSKQVEFVETIDSCGRTLLDIINHVLDYSKAKFTNSSILTDKKNELITRVALEEIDLLAATESVIEVAYSSHEFKLIDVHDEQYLSQFSQAEKASSSSGDLDRLHNRLELLIDVEPRSYGYGNISIDPGAYRTILLNLVGNSLKYTIRGHILVSVALKETSVSGLHDLILTVSDTGVGMSRDFIRDSLFKPFTQADPFSTGTGLGLSIVKELVTSLHGTIIVQSILGQGTTFKVKLPVLTNLQTVQLFKTPELLEHTKVHITHFNKDNKALDRFRQNLHDMCTKWLQMEILDDNDDGQANIIITDESWGADAQGAKSNSIPLLVLCGTVEQYEKSDNIKTINGQHDNIYYCTKPIGPRKLKKAIEACLLRHRKFGALAVSQTDRPAYVRHRTNSFENNEFHTSDDANNITGGGRLSLQASRNSRKSTDRAEDAVQEDFEANNDIPLGTQDSREHTYSRPLDWTPPIATRQNSNSSAATSDSGQSIGSRRKHVLCVEDNPINMALLVAFAKKHNLKATTAINGALGLQRVQERIESRNRGFDAILMDINMPIMNGFDSTQEIRKLEASSGLDRCHIAILTGLSGVQDQKEAFIRGADSFLTKPVKFRQLTEILEQVGVLKAKEPQINE